MNMILSFINISNVKMIKPRTLGRIYMSTENMKVLHYTYCHNNVTDDLSTQAKNLYRLRNKNIDHDSFHGNQSYPNKYFTRYGYSRIDPILIEIYQELGPDQFHGPGCNFGIFEIPKKYEKYYYIDDVAEKENYYTLSDYRDYLGITLFTIYLSIYSL